MKAILAILVLGSCVCGLGQTPPLPPDPIHSERTVNSMSLESRRIAREQAKKQAEYLAYEKQLFADLQKRNLEQQKRNAFLKKKEQLQSPKNKR